MGGVRTAERQPADPAVAPFAQLVNLNQHSALDQAETPTVAAPRAFPGPPLCAIIRAL